MSDPTAKELEDYYAMKKIEDNKKYFIFKEEDDDFHRKQNEYVETKRDIINDLII